ncbi:MAG TPA: hypothetical protein PK040_05010 [Anaerolineaceae bacterium]|nr:hypothetical protein [Anaerolineaceae bacterium]
MKQTTIPVKPDSKLNVKAMADLDIEGSQDKFLSAIVRGGETLKINEVNGGMEIKASTDCRLILPDTMQVMIEKVGGDASVSGLKTRVIIGKVGGDLALQSLAGASIETVGGDLTFRGVSGTLESARVGGDLHGEAFDGITSANIGGDVVLLEINGPVDLSAGGDIELASMKPDLPVISARAGGDLTLIVTPEATGNLELVSGGEDITVHVGDQALESEQRQWSLLLGEGGQPVRLQAGGDIQVTDHKSSESDFEDVFQDISDNWKDFGIELEERIRESLGMASETLARVSQTSGAINDKVRSKIDRAMRKVEEKTSGDEKKRFVGFAFDHPVQAEKPRSGPSDEERMLVLKMLQDKKITVEEAEKLLNALEK